MKNFFARHHKYKWSLLIDIVAIMLSIVIFTAAALPNLLHASAYFDEGYSAYLAQFDLLTIASYTALDVHPPLYYVALHIWQWFAGDQLTSLRVMSVVFGWIAIVFGYLLVRRWFGVRAAITAALLLALSPLLIRYGSTMRMYTMALSLVLAASYILLHAVTSKGKKWWIVYAVLVSAGMWTNYFTALAWITHAVWLRYEFGREKRVIRAWRWSIIGAIVLYIPWLPLLLFRFSEIQMNGFWIKPLSIDTLVSTVTQSLVFRPAENTTGWLAVAVIILVLTLTIAGRRIYRVIDKQKRPAFSLIAMLSFLPVILLAIASLPPLRSSYVYRYILVSAVASTLLIAIILAYSVFRRREKYSQALLYILAVIVFATGALQAVTQGNRNLDVNTQNKLGQAIAKVQKSGSTRPIVVRSPYSYYAARLYDSSKNPIYFIHTEQLSKVGSTKPLYDNPEKSITNFKGLNKVWLVGEDRSSVQFPAGDWQTVRVFVEYDDTSKKPIAFAREIERTTK